MREWSLSINDPLTLSLASDARLGSTDFSNDHIWEFSIGAGEPAGLVIQTTFGLRARSFRIFPRFKENDNILIEPSTYSRAPVIKQFYPNFISMEFSPFPNIDVRGELWVPEPHALAGRYSLINQANYNRHVRLEILAQLSPSSGQRMAPREVNSVWVLAGETANLFPLLFLTGGPQTGAGSYPSILHEIDLPPGEIRQFTWTCAACQSLEESFELARLTAARRWEAERSFLDLLNAGQIEIYSGNPDWDAAFMLAQRTAFSLIVGPTSQLPNPSFVFTRQSDQGYSMRGDGSDYNHLWNGQPPLETYYLASLLLPSGVNLVEGLLRNYLTTQNTEGSIDWKPGLAGQRSYILATPILSTLAWQLFETNSDRQFLTELFPGLLKFIQAWFSNLHDRDGDGIPEWDHPAQMGLEEHPTYSRWHEWSQGIEINTAESPALAAFLYKECQSLVKIAEVLGETESIPYLEGAAERLRLAVEIAWNADLCIYQDVDRDTHFSTHGEKLVEQRGPARLQINKKFEQPVRLLIHIQSEDQSNRRPRIVVQGASATNQPRLERLPLERFKWLLGRGTYTGERVYSTIEQIEIADLEETDTISIYTAGYDSIDQSLLLPLWASIPNQQRADTLVKESLLNPLRFWRAAGLPVCIDALPTDEALICQGINLIWTTFCGEGLVRYNYRQQAAELVNRVMNAIVRNLKTQHAFRRYYHAETGQGFGEWNALHGLAPLGLFLETLGVRILSHQKVVLNGFNPFPWPVTVKYRGLTVLRLKDKSTVIFQDGQTVTVDDPETHIIALEIEPD